jgi:hypothetical protein
VKPWRRQPLLFAVLLAALFVRALVPDGFMPAKGELIELCTLHGPRTVVADPETGELIQVEDEAAQATCPWSLLLTTLATPSFLPPSTVLDKAPGALPESGLTRLSRPSLVVPPARAPPVPILS